MKLLVMACVVCGFVIGCGSSQQSLSFDFVLLSAYPATNTSTAGVEGIVTITNHTAGDIEYTLPEFVGYEVRDAAGTLVNKAAPVTSDPGCACGLYQAHIAAGGSFNVTYGFNATNGTSWALDTPIEPTKMGTNTPTQPVAPGVYQLTVLLLNGDRTNAVTVTVCRQSDGSNEGVCNGPCASQALADSLGAGVVVCGPALTCP